MLLTREQLVIDFCTLPSLELYICMHLICVFRLILRFAVRFLKYKHVHNSNSHSPFLI